MRDIDRFAEFVRRTGARYNEPPETPVEAMWEGVEEGLSYHAPASSGTTGEVAGDGVPAGVGPMGDAPVDALGYREPPPTPHQAMWERIEAQMTSRQPDTVISGGPRGRAAGERRLSRWNSRVPASGWAVALAAAASLVLGLALGRNSGDSAPAVDPIEPVVQTTVSQTAATPNEVPPDQPPAQAAAPTTPIPEVAASREAAAGEPALQAPETVAELPETATTAATILAAEIAPAERPVVMPVEYEAEEDYATTRHLGRAATLLTAFRIDQGTPESEQDLALWARELLGDTRMFLDMPVPRSPVERALLEDLELVLIQIARLGPEAPDFERQLARESMEGQGTLMRLRAATAAGET